MMEKETHTCSTCGYVEKDSVLCLYPDGEKDPKDMVQWFACGHVHIIRDGKVVVEYSFAS
jgi:hypothetical protein